MRDISITIVATRKAKQCLGCDTSYGAGGLFGRTLLYDGQHLMTENPQGQRLIAQRAMPRRHSGRVVSAVAVGYYTLGDTQAMEGYEAYRQGLEKRGSTGPWSSAGNILSDSLGNIDEAVRMAGENKETPMRHRQVRLVQVVGRG